MERPGEVQGGVCLGDKTDEIFVRFLEQKFSEVKFVWGTRRFSYQLKNGVPTVFLGEPQPNFGLLALHELGHALCKHKDYVRDVERIKIESEAWERAKTVLSDLVEEARRGASSKNIDLKEAGCMTINGKDVVLLEVFPEWDEDFVQDKLDTYRDWLHAKSRCKKCGLTKYQTEDKKWHCPRCEAFTL